MAWILTGARTELCSTHPNAGKQECEEGADGGEEGNQGGESVSSGQRATAGSNAARRSGRNHRAATCRSLVTLRRVISEKQED